MDRSPDIVVIGSGMGGATFAAGLAGRGLRVVILERGEHLKAAPENADARAIFQRGYFRPRETWDDGAGRPFNPGNYAYVGGNTKFYGAVLIRYREADFSALEHAEGLSPAWPISYADLEPWYGAAERLYEVRGEAELDPTEPPRSSDYAHGPVPDEPSIAEVRERMAGAGLKPFTLPLGMDIERWLKHAAVPWDAFPNVDDGKSDAETCGLKVALSDPGITLLTGARATRLVTGPGGRIEAVDYEKDGETIRLAPRLVVLAAGAVQSAAMLLANGLANRSDQVGRNFMNHNATALIAIDPRFRNRSVYQKTLGLNDFYFNDGNGGPPLGNVQLLGRVTAPILKANVPFAPEWGLKIVADHAVDWYLMSEDLPHPDSRVRVNGSRIVLDWQRTNWGPHVRLAKVMAERCRAAGFPLVLTKTFDRKTPSHQCGTVRMGDDGASSPVNTHGRAWDHPNLYVVDASVLPTSAAVNPALTVAALALRAADHVLRHELGGAS
ncbi:FAD-dependent oxidoreductase [Oryzibacter oryziterrae]|uniref:FAD-dependent oxidoreductase n=1 Tax=Oryzibacter oryziterrae TaxID=2766474 RepID=UPI001F184C5D|nr:GMC family oxidoreductase [Oryzibacter oryziterrae]